MATRFSPTQTAPTAFTALADHGGSVSHASLWPRLGRCIGYIWLSPDFENGLRQMLFIDAHGANGNGICIDPAKEIIGWDKLVELLRPINVATENNLCVVSEFCEFSGRMAAHLPRPEERSEAECLGEWQQARCLCIS